MISRLRPWARRWGVPLALAVPGVALNLASLIPDPGLDDSWWRDLLMGLGASLVLFSPLYLVTRSLDYHLDRVQAETAAQVERVQADTAAQVERVTTETARQVEDVRRDLSREVEGLRGDVARLEDVAAQVANRLQAEADADKAAFGALRTSPTHDAVKEALYRAGTLA